MDRTPAPISLATARGLPWKPGRSAEAFIDGDLEIRFTPRPTDGPQKPHQRDEVYIVAAGSGFYRVDGKLTPVGTGDMCFAAAHAEHGFESFTEDFAIWIVFYGPEDNEAAWRSALRQDSCFRPTKICPRMPATRV